MAAGVPKRVMANSRSRTATPASTRKTRRQHAAEAAVAEPDQAAVAQNGAAANGAEGAAEIAKCTTSMAAADSSSGGGANSDTSSQDPTISEQELLDEETAGPQEALQEEEQLRKRREAGEARQREVALQALRDNGEDSMLNTESWRNLETLLSRAGMYSQFLREQLDRFDEGLEGSAEQVREQAVEDADAKRKGKGKRKSAGGAAAAAKKAKQQDGGVAPKSATQEMLPLMEGEMRTYQLKGVKWLMSLHQNGLNGILADQMGLGKTVQTIGFLSHLRANKVFGPFLVIGPLSTLPNWVSEFQRWCPQQPVILYHGSKAERADLRHTHLSGATNVPTFPVIVTSFEIVIADSKFLAKHKYKYVIVDEGHRLKNYNCRLLRELRTIPTEQKLLLTGTPLQNNLSELWSLLNFLLPDVFSSVDDFESWFDFGGLGSAGGDAAILAQEQRNKVVTKLHNILKPFLLRRVKGDVETALPGKMEVILYAPMAPAQKKLNDQLLKRTLQDKDISGVAGSSTGISRLNNMLMQMRKVANHPDLVTAAFEKDNLEYPPAEQLIRECGKMALLDRMLTELRKRGHKVLIFSQMTKMLDLLHAYLEERGHNPARIDGSIPWQERQASMQAFNSDPNMFVFLLSTRAGGLGINLTAADTCIIYDSDWNPHQDLQAMDRCHRIGQTRPVLVFRLATAGSVEGKLLARANSKLLLEKLVIKKGSVLDDEAGSGEKTGKSAAGTGMTADQLIELLQAPVDTRSDVAQSSVVNDAMLTKLLDRTHLANGAPHPYPATGKGYQVVKQMEGTGLLKGVQ